jgi:hypothetical protein
MTAHQRFSLPLGYKKIYTKAISSKHAEKSVTVYSKKYKKADLFAVASEKPLSKILL